MTPGTTPPPSLVADRFRSFGQSIFAEMSALALKHNAINLSQGFPDFDGPENAKSAAAAAMHAGHGQYARMIGVPTLNQAVASEWSGRTGIPLEPDVNVTITTGCSEGIGATLMGLLNPGDEVVFFEPFFDFYTACSTMAGAVPRAVSLRTPDDAHDSFWFDPADLVRAITPRTRAILLNTPHNPTGKVFTRDELLSIARIAADHDLIVITDEVYEHLTLEPDLPHIPFATLPGMWDRTITLSSLGKTFSLTGWKVGWAIAPARLSTVIRAAHQFMTFSTATPLQHGAAAVLREPGTHTADLRDLFRTNRDLLSSALRRAGLTVYPSHGTYFLMADHTAVSKRLGLADDRAFCYYLTEKVGVAAIPPSVFYLTPGAGRSLARFAFCKKRQTIEAAIEKLGRITA